MSAADVQGFTWAAARVGGFVAYALVLASVVIGLLLSLKWRSTRFPRVVTNELHRFVTLLALLFSVVHGIAVAVDPFVKLSPLEVLVPLTSHYRPVWMAFGIVGFDLLVAVYLSERVRSRVGYAWWRRFHALAFVVYLFATVHGLATGSDARTPWAIGLYLAGAVVVGGLLLYRLLPTSPFDRRRPAIMAAVVVAGLLVGAWAGSGPLAPGWAAAAGGAASRTQAAAPSLATAAHVDRIALPFQANLRGTAAETTGSRATLTLDGRLSGPVTGRLQVTIPLADDAGPAPLTLTVDPSGATCQGQVTSAERGRLAGTCSLPDGRILALDMRVGLDDAGALIGTVRVTGAGEPATLEPQQN